MAFTNKDDHKDNYKEIFEKLVNERFDEIKKSTNEINHDDLTYHFKGNTARKRFGDYNNGIKNFLKNIIWWNEARGSEKTAECI